MSSPSSNSSILFSSLLGGEFSEICGNLLYVLAVKQGLLKEKQDGTYTPIFEAGKKGLINVLHRWHDLLEENEIPMPTAKEIAKKISNPDGKSYRESTIGKYLEHFRILRSYN